MVIPNLGITKTLVIPKFADIHHFAKLNMLHGQLRLGAFTVGGGGGCGVGFKADCLTRDPVLWVECPP